MTVYITKSDTLNWTHYVDKIINGSVPSVACDNWVFACLRLVALRTKFMSWMICKDK
jgi:hypothetical protein